MRGGPRLSKEDLPRVEGPAAHAPAELGPLADGEGGQNLRLRNDVVEEEELLLRPLRWPACVGERGVGMGNSVFALHDGIAEFVTQSDRAQQP